MRFYKTLLIIFSVSIINNAYSQYILTGEHICGQVWLNFSPAKIIYSSDSLDINNDNVKDFVLTKIFQTGGAVYSFNSFIKPLGINEIVFDRTDTITSNNCGTVLKEDIPKTFNLNDTINANSVWKNSIMTFYLHHFVQSSPGPGSCSYTTNGIVGNNVFIGVRIISAIDTSYGWIQLGNISTNALTFSQSGCELKNYVMTPPSILQNGDTLVSNHSSGNQWFRNDTLLTGETNPYYYMSQNGKYSLVVTENGCVSDTVFINAIIQSISKINFDMISIKPNPVIDEIIIKLPYHQTYNWQICDSFGKPILSGKSNQLIHYINTNDLSKGLYFLKINEKVFKIIKQ
jgi:hypothetical protein